MKYIKNCHGLNCTHISCDISNLAEDEFVLVEIFSRLWVNTLIDNSIFEADISSLAIAQITSLPHVPKYTPPAQVVAVCFIFKNTKINIYVNI